jgi:glutathione S-transferase
MKLYFSPGACSLSPHIVLLEAGLPFEGRRVSTKTHTLADGGDYYAISPNGYVPLLELDNGERLTEGPAIVQYIADQVPDKQLVPPAGSFERYRAMQWLNFISTELHKTYSPLFTPGMPEEAQAMFRDKLVKRYAYVDEQLAGKQFVLGDRFSVADAYLFVVTTWAPHVKVDLGRFTNLANFMERVAQRPAVQKAMSDEGLKK